MIVAGILELKSGNLSALDSCVLLRQKMYSVLSLGGKGSKDLVLLAGGLEATVAVLGGSVDELNVDLFSLPRLDGCEDGLSEGNWSLSGSCNASLNKDVVFVDFTVVGETT